MSAPIVVASALAVMILASTADAAGINLYWDDCGAGGGVMNKSFACNTNVGYQDLYVSVDPPPGVVFTTGHNQIIALHSEHSPLPAWWDFKNAETCRQFGLLGSGDFTTGLSGGAACVDPWQGQGDGGVAAYTKNIGGRACVAQIIGSVAVSPVFGSAMTPGTEHYSLKLRITNAKTVGDGACGDCPDPVCLVLNQVRIAQPPPDPTFVVELERDNIFASWQRHSWCHPSSGDGYIPCATSPVHNRTWGLLKSLYR